MDIVNRAHVLKRCGVIDAAELEREGEERITEQSIYMSMAEDRSPLHLVVCPFINSSSFPEKP